MQRASLQFVNDYNYLRVNVLTSNQVVGSSNLSGRAIYIKGLHHSWCDPFVSG